MSFDERAVDGLDALSFEAAAEYKPVTFVHVATLYSDSPREVRLLLCNECGCVVDGDEQWRHRDWHERLKAFG